MKKLLFSPSLSLVSLLLITVAYGQSIIIPHVSGNIGLTVTAPLNISGLGDDIAPSLSTFDVNIGFDPTILAFRMASFGDPLLGDQLDLFGVGDNPTSSGLVGPGVLNLFELSLDTPEDLNNFQAGSFTLATLTFEAIGVGSSSLDTSINAIGDAFGDPLPVNVSNGSVTIEVPEPSTIMMLSGICVLGLLSYAYRRRYL